MNLDTLQLDEAFFVFDSNSLTDVNTKLYGFAITDNGIFDNNSPLPDIALAAREKTGSFVFVEKTTSQIIVTQDFAGDYGLFLYRYDDYYALSNSFWMLLDHVKKQGRPLTLNRDYANAFLTSWIVSMAYSSTAICEIERIPANDEVFIDLSSKDLRLSSLDFKFNSIPSDSEEGIKILDAWYEKWVSVARGVANRTNNLKVDLSGGIDSRLTFSLFVNSGVDLTKLYIYSYEDLLHTHSEDFEIASSIASRYNFELNKRDVITSHSINLSNNEALILELHAKMLFQKELSFPTAKMSERLFSFGGYGGECIRPFWFMNTEEFIAKQHSYPNFFSYTAHNEIYASTEKVLNESLSAVEKKYNLDTPNSEYYSFHMHRECLSRNHYGRNNVEGFLINKYNISPLMDPLLHKLTIDGKSCIDKNFLIALIFTRYAEELLEFPFDSSHHLNKNTLDYARSVSSRFPLSKISKHEPSKDFLLSKEEELETELYNAESLTPNELKRHVEKVFLSDDTWLTFCRLFNPEIYDLALYHRETIKYHPLRHANSIVGIVSLIKALSPDNSEATNLSIDYLLGLTSKSSSEYCPLRKRFEYLENLVDHLQDSATLRIDVESKNSNYPYELSISDDYARVSKPNHLNTRGGIGYSIESMYGKMALTILAQHPIALEIKLRSRDTKPTIGTRLENRVNVTSFSINNDEQLQEPISIWHDAPFGVSISLLPNKPVTLSVQWKQHNLS